MTDIALRGNASTSMSNPQSLEAARHALVSVASLVVIAAGGTYVLGKMEAPAKEIRTYCNVNFTGEGHCYFTNAGTGSSAKCTRVSLTSNDMTERDEATVCSGKVGPYESKSVSYPLNASKVCKGDWDSCKFEVN